jgi:hypothetical protein
MTNSNDVIGNRTRGILACSAVPPSTAPPPSPVYDSISLNSLKKEKCFRQKFVEKIKPHILCSITFTENRTVYEIMWKNTIGAGQAAGNNIIWCMRFACWKTKATDTHSEDVLLNDFPWQQWLSERASVLMCTLSILFHLPTLMHNSFIH